MPVPTAWAWLVACEPLVAGDLWRYNRHTNHMPPACFRSNMIVVWLVRRELLVAEKYIPEAAILQKVSHPLKHVKNTD